ncbi:MAG: efflux RND transporter periplasmic adaptor subunit [Gemmatimonadales bacterium]|jgi:membrane fusion protein (multidrug efflux system)
MTKRIVFGLIGLVLITIIVLRVIQASRPAEASLDVSEIRAQTGLPVEVAEVRTGTLVAHRKYTGTIRGIRSATIRARTGDEIVEIPVRVGQRVATGDVLVRQSSEGSMASVTQAEAAREQARRTVDRLRPLWEQGAVSEQDWDNATTNLAVAEANLAAARRAIVLVSPIDGIVTDILETRGTVPSAGDPLVRVSDLSRVQVLLNVSTAQARELAPGQPVRIAGYEEEGSVTRIALQADPETRLVEVEATFAGTRGSSWIARGLTPGGLVSVDVEVGREESALLVPRSAVSEGGVWVVDGAGVAQRRAVTFGLTGEDEVQVLDGLADGERVVVAGASLLSDGAQTRIVGG